MTDRNFDALADRFESKLYGNWRGQLRLQLVNEALLEDATCLQQKKPLRILDAGCGLGQMSLLLAERGHHVTACDVSSVLIERAQARIRETNSALLSRIDFHCCSLQSIGEHVSEPFDLIIFHAVLEWLDNPQAGLQSLLPLLKTEGELSLLFYNRHSIVLKNLLRGDFRRIDEQDFGGDPGGLTPINPLPPEEVSAWLKHLSLVVKTERGIRTFYDYMEQSMDRNKPRRAGFEEILRMERKFSTQEPYRSLARYLLWHCRKSPGAN